MENDRIKIENIKLNNGVKNIVKNRNKIDIVNTMQSEKNSLNISKNSDLNSTINNNMAMKNSNHFLTNFLKNRQFKVIIIVLLFAFGALIILNSSFSKSLTKTSKIKNSQHVYMSSLEYCEQLENRLMNVFGKISGVGKVKVMVTVESSPELIIASSSDEKTNNTTNGTNSTNSSMVSKKPIIVTNSGLNAPLVLTEKVPQIKGIVVVAEGAKDVRIKLSLLEAIQALLHVKNDNIQIYY